MFCTNCGKELPSGTKFCTECGCSTAETPVSKNPPTAEPAQSSPYPIVKVTNVKKVLYAGFGVFSIPTVLWLISTRLSLIGSSSFSFLSLLTDIALLIGCALLVLGCWFSRKEPFYVVPCPYCGSEVHFPTDEQGMDCPCCGKRMILKDNLIRQIPDAPTQQ